MGNLLDSLKGLATNELISAASKSMGESESGIGKAIGAIFPSILGGVMNSNSSSHSMIGDLLGKAGGNSNMVTDLIGSITGGSSDSPSMGIGGSLIKGIFGDKVAGIANLISNFSGIKSGSSNSLLSIGGSLIASFLGKKMLGEGLNFGGIMSWLGGQKSEIESAIPSGFSSLMSGAGSVASNVSSTASKITSSAVGGHDDDDKGGSGKWILPIILIGLLGAFLWYWLGNKKDSGDVEHKAETEMHAGADHAQDQVDHAQTTADNTLSSAAKGKLVGEDWITEKGAAKKIKLADGTEIDATEGGFEDLLVNFINDGSAKIDTAKGNWFNFDNVLFETGKSTLKPGAEAQIQNVGKILMAYPNVKVKIGGYTDNVGDSTANMKLSEARAKTVYNNLTGFMAGMNKDVKSHFSDKPFQGFGHQWPVADNSTAEGRAQNRRISVNVKAK